jgi:hypothetical protein
MRIARRNILLSFLGLTAVHMLGLKNVLAAHSEHTAVDHLARQLATLVPHPESARLIGAAYLAAKPQEADVMTLIKFLCPDLPDLNESGLNGRLQILPRAWLRRRLAVQRSDDFSEGRIVRLKGWIVANTEARLCALVALCTPPTPKSFG